jgi:hypothetical protein
MKSFEHGLRARRRALEEGARGGPWFPRGSEPDASDAVEFVRA